ncbi:MAG: apolipoprotein N-acyltransferase [Cyclobacteriaceae bacterium]|nr:apolipoprotein N-acyltransferase [Cyclobacteriaceae bacterium]MCH8515396.1 apolipoprotein N-acyltransferase [Cyclobacteriaceae bacterium]
MNQKTRQQSIIAFTLGGAILMTLSFPPVSFSLLIFVGMITPFALEHVLRVHALPNERVGGKIFLWTYLFFFLWNTGLTWWVGYASIAGAAFMLIVNSLFMSIPWLLYHFTNRKAGTQWGYGSIFFYWLGFEYLHAQWELSWPWLQLGNAFADWPQIVQWYSFTGVIGGTLWVLAIAFLLFYLVIIKQAFSQKYWNPLPFLYVFLGILIPSAISWMGYLNYEPKGRQQEVVILQPNINPYTKQFVHEPKDLPFSRQLPEMMERSDRLLTDSTAFLVWPEVALRGSFEEKYIEEYPIIDQMREWVSSYPHLNFLTGLLSFKRFEEMPETHLPSMRKTAQGDIYEVYNASFQMDASGVQSFYHKSKLLPGVEAMPYPTLFTWLNPILERYGGGGSGFGKQANRSVFVHSSLGGAIAPAICYESIFSDFLTEFVRNGAEALFIMTNDAWWDDSPGYKQHFSYSKLRAIELRRDVVRAANTGISGFIDQRGKVLSKSSFYEPTALRSQVHFNSDLSFYAKHGDYIGKLAAWVSVILFFTVMGKHFLNRKKATQTRK